MSAQQLLDAIPVPLTFLLIAAVLLLGFEVGFRGGRWWQDRTPEETEGPTGTLVGSLLALMAFLLAITMSMASDRFDTRRGLVLQEANAIGTTYLRAGYLPAPYGDESRALLRQYVPLRITTTDRAELAANIAKSEEIQAALWTRAEAVARDHGSDVNALYIESLNEVIDLHTSRVIAGIYARVPETILVLLLVGSALTLVMVGYGAGLTRRRSSVTAIVLVIALSAVLTIVIDLDRPRDGLVQVNQQPLIDLQRQLGPP
jgi:hypothetical protein